jgi:hypothetical protein
MSLLAIVYQLVPEAPILIAHNRDELYERICPSPAIQSGKPRILAGIDPASNGTYLGVNQYGMFVGLVRRNMPEPPSNPKSRGALCRKILKNTSANSALDACMDELQNGKYCGGNFVIADSDNAWVIHHTTDSEVITMDRGLRIVGEFDVDDPTDERANMARRLLTLQTLDSPVKFLAVASKVFARPPSSPGRPSMVMRNGLYGTVSSTLISLGKKPRDAIYQHCNGAPDRAKFEDYSPLLRDILSRGLREARSRATSASR